MQDIKHGKVVLKLDQVVKAQGISISKLAFRAEMQRTQLKSYMKNEVQRVDLDILARLCHALECDITDLLEYKKEQP
ncbi:MAG: helix-turn-helix transcriptional regulator [Eubacteriales bacterium]|nr:helix-turn-helix transcriptional regulator [Eubacteriales bacterium]